MKSKKKPILRKTFTASDGDTSAFVLDNMKAHIKIADVSTEALMELNKQLEKIVNKYELRGSETLELLYQFLHQNIITFCLGQHISPRFFVNGIRMMKDSLEFANHIGLNNVSMNSLDNIRLLEEKVRFLMKDLPVTFEEIPGTVKIVREHVQDMN